MAKDRTIDRHKKPKRREKWYNRKKDENSILLTKVSWEEDHAPICGGSLAALEEQLKKIR